MNTPSHKILPPTEADPQEWPLQIHQHSYGWSVTYYSKDGHVRHLLTVDTQMQAFRNARNLGRRW